MKNKKDIHRTGALGALLQQGNLTTIHSEVLENPSENHNEKPNTSLKHSAFVSHQFSQVKNAELINISPDECVPWKYANRSREEFGNIEELAQSLKLEGQQEPILVRYISSSQNVSSSVKYEIIFGRRRWEAARIAKIDLIAVLKNLSDRDAAVAQSAENKHREAVSPYSEAIHYSQLLSNQCFNNEIELATALNIPRATFNDLMSFTKIPVEVIQHIPNIHGTSITISVALYSLCKKFPSSLEKLKELSTRIGTTITSPKKLYDAFENFNSSPTEEKNSYKVTGFGGTKLFTIRRDSNGSPCIVLHKVSQNIIDLKDLSKILQNYIDEKLKEQIGSGAPDSRK